MCKDKGTRKMELIFLGSGSAFTVGNDNYQSNVLLKHGHSDYLLIDCGSDARLALYEQGIPPHSIQDVYISHLHADHVGGLEWFAFFTKFGPHRSQKPCLHISKNLAVTLWENVLSGGLSSLEECQASLETFFEVDAVEGSFSWQGIEFELVPTVHTYSNHLLCPSYGLFFSTDELRILFSTDVQFVPDKMAYYYDKADLIFHDCETSETKSAAHAHYDELLSLDPLIKAKMWLYHYNPGLLPDAKQDGFRGFVKKGQRFNFADF